MINLIKQILLLIKNGSKILKFLETIFAKIVDFFKEYGHFALIEVICVGALVLAFLFINWWSHRDITFTKDSYIVSLSGTSITVKAPFSGKITKINPRIYTFVTRPDDLIQLKAGDLIAQLDTTQVDQQLDQLRKKRLDLGGKKTLITEQITESPDKNQLFQIELRLKELYLKKSQISANLIDAQAQLSQAEDLFNKKVVTQDFLNDAKSHYLDLVTQSEALDIQIQDTTTLYNQISKYQSRDRIILHSEKDGDNSEAVNQWIAQINEEIDQVLKQKNQSTITAPSDLIISKFNSFEGKVIKEGEILLEGIDPSSLGGSAEISSDDVKLIKGKKVKIYFQNNFINTEINSYQLKGNVLSFKLPEGTKFTNKTGQIIIERVKK